jgi:hypothetical protein
MYTWWDYESTTRRLENLQNYTTNSNELKFMKTFDLLTIEPTKLILANSLVKEEGFSWLRR